MNQTKPTLYLIRGLPGSGKSTFANTIAMNIGASHFEADQWMLDDLGEYKFDPSKLAFAHNECQVNTKMVLNTGYNVVVSNTSTTEKEVQVYSDIAKEVGANFVSLIVENRHGNSSVHAVPEETLDAMKKRFSVKL